MQVARAAGTPSTTPGPLGLSTRTPTSYAPLYITSALRDMAFDIEELEGIALDRLKVLKAAEAARSASTLGPPTPAKADALRTAVRVAERAAGLNIPPPGNPGRDDRVLKDEASHFLLRLALCKTHEHRNWLLATEFDLFSARLEGAGAEFALRAIEKANGPVVRLASPADVEQFHAELDAVARGPCRQRGDDGARYYTVAFEEVPLLVKQRRVFLHRGVAYVPEGNVLDVVAAQFRAKLSLALVTASKAVALADGDQRMHPVLESIRQHFLMDQQGRKGFDPSQGIESISLNQLNESLPAMPLCMANMMTRLREQHHLRHSARMQLGVFLKGCGLSLDESLRFWKTEFGKGAINAEKFEKSYAYNIRHHYGKEGKRRNLPPFACIRVISDRPGPGEHNGCPYREFEETRLKSALRSIGTDPNAITAIAAKAKEGNFQTACGMCFASSQPGRHAVGDHGFPKYIPTHPNEYFIEARKRRFGPRPESQMLDEDIADEEMLEAAAAAESQSTPQTTPRKAPGENTVSETPVANAANELAKGRENIVPETPILRKESDVAKAVGNSVPETPTTKGTGNGPGDAEMQDVKETPVVKQPSDDVAKAVGNNIPETPAAKGTSNGPGGAEMEDVKETPVVKHPSDVARAVGNNIPETPAAKGTSNSPGDAEMQDVKEQAEQSEERGQGPGDEEDHLNGKQDSGTPDKLKDEQPKEPNTLVVQVQENGSEVEQMGAPSPKKQKVEPSSS